jgi:hypothetical protein
MYPFIHAPINQFTSVSMTDWSLLSTFLFEGVQAPDAMLHKNFNLYIFSLMPDISLSCYSS